MAEQELTGGPGVEAAQGFTPLPDPIEPQEEKTFGSDADGLREAAKELVNRDKSPEVPQESEAPLTERGYVRNKGSDGVEHVDESKTISAERAARDLTENRKAEVDQTEAALRQLAAQEVDAVRAAQGLESAPDPVAESLRQFQAEQVQPQPEVAPQSSPSGLHPDVEAALKNPHVRQAIESDLAQAATARQHYAAAIEQTKDVAVHAVLSRFPELQGLNSQQAAIALKMMETQNPQRFQEAVGELQQVRALHDMTMQARQQETQRQQSEYKSKWAEYVHKEDAKFIDAMPEMADSETARKYADLAVATLRNVGFADHDLKRAWMGEASLSLRDSRAQVLIMKAAKYDAAMQGSQHPVRNIPFVQRPGVATLRGERDDVRLADLNNRLSQTGSAKDAAALLIAKRARG